jgi:3-hydroxyacyl-CoA dehydrogenase
MNTRADIRVEESVAYVAPSPDIAIEDGVAHIALNPSHFERLDRSVLQQIETALSCLANVESVEIVVLSAKSGFPSGLTDPRGGGDDTDNLLAKVCNTLDAFPKPIVAVLTGTVVGGGAELALACHYRLAHRGTRFGFPNARLGLVPNAGATQRLPRLIGAKPTLDLLLGGQLMAVTDPALRGLADMFFDDKPFEAVLRFAQHLGTAGAQPRPTSQIRSGFANAQDYQNAIRTARKALEGSRESAATHIVSAVEAALVLPIGAGLAFEQATYEDCCATPNSRAATHIFLAEQHARTYLRRRDLPAIKTIAVLGGGPFASQLVLSALDAGVRVNWAIKDPNQKRDSVGYVDNVLRDGVSKGHISALKAEQCQNALNSDTGSDPFKDASIALRAARGQRGAAIPAELPIVHCLPGADPRLAMRFGPTHLTPQLVEIVLGPQGEHTQQRMALSLAKRLNLLAIPQRANGLCLSDRLRHAQWRAADALVDLGQSPYTIDAAMRDWGFDTSPYLSADHTGLGAIAKHERHTDCTNWAGVLVKQGRVGFGSSGGFYSYNAENQHATDETVLEIINARRAPAGEMPAARIHRLILGAMANEAARALRESQVECAADVDVVSVYAGLLPHWSGGLLHSATAEGLFQISHTMSALKHPDTEFWKPDPVMTDLIKNGRGFDFL